MPQRGFTLLELLITLVICTLILSIGLPGLQRHIDRTRTLTFTHSLQDAIQTTRHRAVAHNGRATLRALGSWEQGWELFDDQNHNGVRDDGERALLSHAPEAEGLSAFGNQWVKDYISYVGTGESRHASGTPRGGFQAGSITICSPSLPQGYKLVLARMGRVRREVVEASECPR